MNREKIVEQLSILKTLLEDWDSLESKELQKQAELLIIKKAAELVNLVTEDKKSEMPCNCVKCDKDEYDETVRRVAKVFEILITSLDTIIASKKNP